MERNPLHTLLQLEAMLDTLQRWHRRVAERPDGEAALLDGLSLDVRRCIDKITIAAVRLHGLVAQHLDELRASAGSTN